jgi:hypothetical protein
MIKTNILNNLGHKANIFETRRIAESLCDGALLMVCFSLRFVCILILIFVSLSAKAQDIEAMLNAPVLGVNGGISVNSISTFTPGDTTATSDPFALFLSGNLNFSLFGAINVPLTFAYTNQQLTKSISLPFNRFALAPSYKWIKVYVGYTAMNFSSYSLAGHELFGGGVELSPDNGFKISALYGRLKKASEASEGLDGAAPVFQRMGGGFKVEYQKEKYTVGVNLFKAQDLTSSLPLANPDSMSVLPQDNLTGSINVNLNVINNLRFSTEYGFSALNRNIYSQSDKFRLLTSSGDLAVYHAIKAQATFTQKIGTVGATYEYVAPNYTTLGAYYMTNDFENITATISTTVKKYSITLDAGYQRNNLDKQKNSTSSRFIYSANISGNITEKLNVAASFSNLQSYLYINDVYSQVTQTNPFQNLDTLNVTQLNYTASLNTGYTLQNTDEQRQSLNMNLMYQRSAEAQQYSKFSGDNIYNAALAYQFSHVPSQFNSSASVNYNRTQMPEDMFTQAINYNFSLGKNFFKQLQTSFSVTYSDMDSERGDMSNVLNIRLSGGYTLAKKHNFNIAATSLYTDTANKKRTQYAINLSYAYSFGVQVNRKNKKLNFNTEF